MSSGFFAPAATPSTRAIEARILFGMSCGRWGAATLALLVGLGGCHRGARAPRTAGLTQQTAFPQPPQPAPFSPAASPYLAPYASAPPAPVRLTPAQIAKRAKDSVVIVRVNDGLGTGFAVAPGVLATNLHVVAGADRIVIVPPDGHPMLASHVVGIDDVHDIVLLFAEGAKGLPPLELGDDTVMNPGDPVVAVGSPRGFAQTISTGVISAVRRLDPETTVLQTTAPISPGSSGGPLFNEYGTVIGVTTLYVRDSQNLNFVSPSRYIRKLLSVEALMDLASFAQKTRPESPATTSTPTPATQSQPEPKAEKVRFPESVSGFRFGMTIREAAAACPSISGNQTHAICPDPPVDLRFANGAVTLTFAAGRLSIVTIDPVSRIGANEALRAKYGNPDGADVRREGRWQRANRWPLDTPGRFFWMLDGGRIVLVSLDGKHVAVSYVSAANDVAEESNY